MGKRNNRHKQLPTPSPEQVAGWREQIEKAQTEEIEIWCDSCDKQQPVKVVKNLWPRIIYVTCKECKRGK